MTSLHTALATIVDGATYVDIVNHVVQSTLVPSPHYLPAREQPEDMPEANSTNWPAANLKVLEPAPIMVEFPYGVHILDRCVRLTFPFILAEILHRDAPLLDFNYTGVQGLIGDVLDVYRTGDDPLARRGAELFLRALPDAINVEHPSVSLLRCRLPVRSTLMRAMRDIHHSLFSCWGPVEKRCVRATFGTFIFVAGTPLYELEAVASSLGFVFTLDPNARVVVYQTKSGHRSTDLETARRTDLGRTLVPEDLKSLDSVGAPAALLVPMINAVLDARQQHYEAQIAYDDVNRAWESRFYTEGLLDYEALAQVYADRVAALDELIIAKHALSIVGRNAKERAALQTELESLRRMHDKRRAQWAREITELTMAAHRRWKTQLNAKQVALLSRTPRATDDSVMFTIPADPEAPRSLGMRIPPHRFEPTTGTLDLIQGNAPHRFDITTE